MKGIYLKDLFFKEMWTSPETFMGFLFFLFCAFFGFIGWKGFQRLKPILNSPFRYALWGLGMGWIFMFCGVLFWSLLSKTMLLKEGEIYVVAIGYLMGIYLPFFTGILIVWGLIRAIGKRFRKTTRNS